MKVAIIGAGNMGGATAVGLAKAGKISPSDITVTCRTESKLARFAEMGISTTTDNREAAASADVLMLVVKPWILPDVIAELKPVLDYDRQVIISMAPGVKEDELLALLDKDGKTPSTSYVIPNIAIEYCASMTFIAPVTSSSSDVHMIEDLFAGTGDSMVVGTRQLQAGTSLASCGIAYALRYIHAAAQGGVELGMFPKDAVKIVSQTVEGAVAVLKATGSHPEEEIDKVTTPGGMTIKGLNAMEEAGFTTAVIKGLKAGK